MRRTLFFVLEIFLLNTLLYFGQAKVTAKAVVTIQPNWPEMYFRETITLRCEVKNGGDTVWEYKWKTTNSIKPSNVQEYRFSATESHIGKYRCSGRNKTDLQPSTKWSDAFTLNIYSKPTRPVLTVSPLWPTPGDSVTLTCSVEHPSAGWRFYWYKAVPRVPEMFYNRKLLPDSTTRTKQDSYIVHGPSNTMGYMCRVKRGDPVYETLHSHPKFVWFGDLNSSASLTVTPDRVQHFSSESLSLSCKGKSTIWKVMRFSERGILSPCHDWGTMNGSTCHIHTLQYTDAVYWCESGSEEFSNAVNITVQCPCIDSVPQPQSAHQDEWVNQDQTQEHIYTSPLEGDVCIYESIGGCKDTGKAKENGNDATFHSIQLSGLEKKRE